MAGRIRDDDVVAVRERAALADVVVESGVQLRSAGGGRLKGLCPFHEEKTPSFNVNPAVGYYMCFGCGESGDVISYVRKTEQLSFVEAMERLAGRYGVELRYEQGGAAPRQQTSQRTRMVEAHKHAVAFYRRALAEPEGQQARQFLAERGFDADAAAAYGLGYAPRGWDVLVKRLRGLGFSGEELVAAGLASNGRSGPVDRFRDRLVWPIRDVPGDVIGFGARKLSIDPRDDSPKYLNTPETPLYKKSSVLYGVDLAKKEIARRRQAVVVEGYTDVMACHLAGVPTAVATCGTAFGSDHISVLRRLLMDSGELRGEVVFLFDGDAAGQKAALKAFDDDQRFVTQTFVAVTPGGLDPCDLRLAKGDAAVRDLVASRVPLVEFALRSLLARYDLETAEGRVQALAATAPLVAKIKDRALRPEYARRLAGWLGMEVELVAGRVGELSGEARPPAQRRPAQRPPSRDEVAVQVEREAVKLAVQAPVLVAPLYDDLDEDVFTDPGLRAAHRLVLLAGGTAGQAGGEGWVGLLREVAPDDDARREVAALAVEPLRTDGEPDTRYATAVLQRLKEFAVSRRIAELKPRLQRVNPVEEAEQYGRLFAELIALEQTVRALREAGVGDL
ncbi:MAG: DNA primase [Actinomycetota bacterium]|nr:DNA primase [Actinomycetota bacterium]